MTKKPSLKKEYRREWECWYGMIARCTKSSATAYHRYGGRGIDVCQRWRDSFPMFVADMGPRPTSRHSIGRIDNDGNYSPENCRWETVQQQSINRRKRQLCPLVPIEELKTKFHPEVLQLLVEIEDFRNKFDVNPTQFGLSAVNDGRFLSAVRNGRTPSLGTIDRVRKFMRTYQQKSA